MPLENKNNHIITLVIMKIYQSFEFLTILRLIRFPRQSFKLTTINWYFPPRKGERQPLLHPHERSEPSPGPSHESHETSRSGSFFEQVAEGIQERDRARMKQEVQRYGSFVSAILSWYA